MSVIHIDFESHYDTQAGITLAKMSLRKYLEVAPVIGFSVAIDRSAPTWIPAESDEFLPALAEIDEALQRPGNLLNAYNVPFDARVMRFGRLEPYGEPFGCRWPKQIRDTMELAMAAWSNQPGGYSLRNVASWLHLPPKLSMDDVLKGRADWQSYCNRDTELLQAIYYRALDRLPDDELLISEMANRIRGHAYQIHAETVDTSLKAFTANTAAGVEAAVKFLSNYARDGEDLGAGIFGGYQEGKVRSVKSKALRELLVGALGFDTKSTSLKKINPVHLAARPDVATLLQATSKANKGLYYQKRAQALVGTTEVDMELGYFRATNTGRYSAPTTGKGINCLAGDTPVVTEHGVKRLDAVLASDRVWDGEEFVEHGGLVFRGHRSCITVGGVTLTPDHRIRTPAAWRTALWVARHPTTTLLEPESGAGSSSLSSRRSAGAGRRTLACASSATAELKARLTPTSSERASNARSALSGAASVATRSSPTTAFAAAGSNAGTASSSGSSTPITPSTPDTAAAESACTPRGLTIRPRSSRTSRLSRATSKPSLSPSSTPSTGSTMTGTTSPETSGSSTSQPTTEIKPTTECVYDLLDCGPRSRFQAGGLVVHNCHNLSKKDKTIAKPLRQMLALPDDMVYVRADAASVEYRTEAWLTDCAYVREMYKKDIDADAYSNFGLAGFGVVTKKGEPMRDIVCKAGVLGYGFCMALLRATEELNKAVADPLNKVSPADIEALCAQRGWRQPQSRYLKGVVTRVGCHWSIAVAANESREAFHGLHPEFFATADWLQRSVELLAASKDPERLVDRLYEMSGAPDRDKIDLSIDKELEFPTVRARLLNHSMPTVTWRHLSCSHPGIDGLGAVTANKGPRNVHRALLIENVTQSAARNMLVRAKLELEKRGYPLVASVHDELLLLVPRERNAVLKARHDLLEVMSPRGPLGFGWAFYAKPSEVTVTRTLYEDQAMADVAWKKLEANDPTWKDHLS